MFQKLEQKVILSGLSRSTLYNYGRSIAQISLHFRKPPLELSDQSINEYLLELKAGKNPSESYFKHTVYGLRYLFRLFEREDRAISWLKAVSNHQITFSYKDYKNNAIKKEIHLHPTEFVRRFALHILPHGFARMRHFGLRSSRGKSTYLPNIQSDMNIFPYKLTKEELRQAALNRLKRNGNCPCCGSKKIVEICHFPRGEPPDEADVIRAVLKL